jgi:hypothetical protein
VEQLELFAIKTKQPVGCQPKKSIASLCKAKDRVRSAFFETPEVMAN